MCELGVHLLFISIPDRVHWQEKRSVRKSAHYARAFDAGGPEVQAGVTGRAESKGKENGDGSFQTLVTEDSVARDHRGGDDAARVGALLQSTGGESRAFHGN